MANVEDNQLSESFRNEVKIRERISYIIENSGIFISYYSEIFDEKLRRVELLLKKNKIPDTIGSDSGGNRYDTREIFGRFLVDFISVNEPPNTLDDKLNELFHQIRCEILGLGNVNEDYISKYKYGLLLAFRFYRNNNIPNVPYNAYEAAVACYAILDVIQNNYDYNKIIKIQKNEQQIVFNRFGVVILVAISIYIYYLSQIE